MKKQLKNSRVIYDVLYGFVPITEWEEKIIDTPFFQRLRWIRQLGFSSYIFPGAEHNRFSHAIGVMHSMDQMIRATGLAVPDHELFNPRAKNKAATLHKCLRIAALLHDIGTFPFSHAIEYSYIRHGTDFRSVQNKQTKSTRRRPAGTTAREKAKNLPNSHEHLGSFIIKNTKYEGGITRILEDYGLDVQMISKMIKGESPYLIANQLMHSDLDADRMDYLLRDAHYTGLKYGQFDREYILANLTTFNIGKNKVAFGIRESAAHAVEDFLFARFSWYSQVIKNPDSAKFDIMATEIAKALLELDLMHQFHDLLSMVENKGERFFWWNDNYFITTCQDLRYKNMIKDPRISELIEMLLYRRAPKTVPHPLFEHRLISSSEKNQERAKLTTKIHQFLKECHQTIERHGNKNEWILYDIPDRDVVFTTSYPQILKGRSSDNLFLERDPIKLISKEGKPLLLIDKENSLMKHISGVTNFVPSLFANDSALKLLRSKKLISP